MPGAGVHGTCMLRPSFYYSSDNTLNLKLRNVLVLFLFLLSGSMCPIRQSGHFILQPDFKLVLLPLTWGGVLEGLLIRRLRLRRRTFSSA